MRPQAGRPADDVQELLRAQLQSEAGLRDDDVGVSETEPGGDETARAVGDVRERAAVHERRSSLDRLHEVRQQRIAQQDDHRPFRAQVARVHGPILDVEADQAAGETLLEIDVIAREAEHCHHFGRGRHVEALLSRDTVPRAAQADDDVTEGPVVHVDAAAPDDASGIEARAAAVVQIVVGERREEVVGCPDCRDVAGEVQVDVFHRQHLGPAAAGAAALDAEHRSQRWLANRRDGAGPEPAQRGGEPDGHRGLALPVQRGRHPRDQHQRSARGAVAQGIELDLGLVTAEGLDVGGEHAQLVGDVRNRPQAHRLGDVEAG